jgi:hypothetical protein
MELIALLNYVRGLETVQVMREMVPGRNSDLNPKRSGTDDELLVSCRSVFGQLQAALVNRLRKLLLVRVHSVWTTGAEPIGDLEGSRDGPGENAELCSSRADASDDELGCIVVAEDGLDVGRL